MKNQKNNHIYDPCFFLFTCVKNGKKYINRLFNSLLNQTCYNFIHYIYDDGSDEEIKEEINNYKNSAKYTVIYEKNPINIGLNMATKHCIEKCTLPYFVWINCDDWVDTKFFEVLEKYINKHKNYIVYRSNRIDYRDGVFGTPVSTHGSKSVKKKDQAKQLTYYSFSYSTFCVNYTMWTKINPNDIFLDIRWFYNDAQVLTCCLESKYKFAFIDKLYSYYFANRNGESYTYTKPNFDVEKRLLIKKLNIVERKSINVAWLDIKDNYEKMIYSLNKLDYQKAKIYLKTINKIKRNHHIHKNVFEYRTYFYWLIRCCSRRINNLIIKRQ